MQLRLFCWFFTFSKFTTDLRLPPNQGSHFGLWCIFQTYRKGGQRRKIQSDAIFNKIYDVLKNLQRVLDVSVASQQNCLCTSCYKNWGRSRSTWKRSCIQVFCWAEGESFLMSSEGPKFWWKPFVDCIWLLLANFSLASFSKISEHSFKR